MGGGYETKYEEWVKNLPKKERQKLKEAGIDKPLTDERLSTPDYASKLAKMSVRQEKHSNQEDSAIQVLAYVLARLQSKSGRDALIDRDALVFALGLNLLEGATETDIAKRYSMTRQAFSVRVKKWQKLLGLRPSIFMKSEKACRSYQKARVKHLTRHT